MDALREYEALLETTASPGHYTSTGNGFTQDSFTFSRDNDDFGGGSSRAAGRGAPTESRESPYDDGARSAKFVSQDISGIYGSTQSTQDIAGMYADVSHTSSRVSPSATPTRRPYQAPHYDATENTRASPFRHSTTTTPYMASEVFLDSQDDDPLPSEGSYSVPAGDSDAGVSSVAAMENSKDDRTQDLVYFAQGRADDTAIAMHHDTGAGVTDIGTDIDAETLSSHIDTHAAAYKRSVMNHFIEVKTRIHEQHQSHLDKLAQTHANELAMKQDEIESMKEDMAALLELVNRTEVVKQHMAHTLGYRAEQERMRNQVKGAFSLWYAHTVGRRKDAQRRARMQTHYERTLLRRSLRQWRRAARELGKHTQARRLQQRVERKEKEIANLYREEIALAHKERDDARETVRGEQAMRAQLEENLKKAFMRGVVALNMEAMSIMKDGNASLGADGVGASVLEATRDLNQSVAWSQHSGTQPLNASHLGIMPGRNASVSFGGDTSVIAPPTANTSASASVSLARHTPAPQQPAPVSPVREHELGPRKSPIRGSREHSHYLDSSLGRDLTVSSAVNGTKSRSRSSAAGKKLSTQAQVVKNPAHHTSRSGSRNRHLVHSNVIESDEHPRSAVPHPSRPAVVRERPPRR